MGSRVVWVMRERGRCWCVTLVVRDGARAERRVSGKGGIQGSVGGEEWRAVLVAREGGRCWRQGREGSVDGEGGRAALAMREAGRYLS